MLNDPRTRLRKMAQGWKVIRKAFKTGNVYDATIHNVGADTYRTRVTDKDKVVISAKEFNSLEEARKDIRGNFMALGCKIPQSRASESKAVTAPVITTLVNQAFSPASPTTAQTVTASVLVKDQFGLELPGITVTFAATGSAVKSSATAVTNSSGIASITITDAVAEAVTVTTNVGAVTDADIVTFVAP